MTMEHAAQIVSILRCQQSIYAIDLFDHFISYFKLNNEGQELFAQMCGYVICK